MKAVIQRVKRASVRCGERCNGIGQGLLARAGFVEIGATSTQGSMVILTAKVP